MPADTVQSGNEAMRRDKVLATLAEHRADLERLGVKSIAVFGSVARDAAGPQSDVDVLVEFARPVGLFAFVRVQEYLQGLLGCVVDVVTPDGLKPQLRDHILREAVHAG